MPSRDAATFPAKRPRHNGSITAGLSSPRPLPGGRDSGEIARSQRRGRPGIAPEFPVCRPTRAFARPATRVDWQSVGVAVALSTIRRVRPPPAGFPARRRERGKPCGSRVTAPRNCDGRSGLAPHRLRSARTRRIVYRDAQPQVPMPEKYLGRRSSRVRSSPPIAHLSPGASLCPSGNQGAAATCRSLESRNGSTGLPQKVRGSQPRGDSLASGSDSRR